MCGICTEGLLQVQKTGYCCIDSKSFGSPHALVKTPHIWLFCPWERKIRGREKDSHATGCSNKYKNQCQKFCEGQTGRQCRNCPCDILQLYIHHAWLRQLCFSSAATLASFLIQIHFKCELWTNMENSSALALQVFIWNQKHRNDIVHLGNMALVAPGVIRAFWKIFHKG